MFSIHHACHANAAYIVSRTPPPCHSARSTYFSGILSTPRDSSSRDTLFRAFSNKGAQVEGIDTEPGGEGPSAGLSMAFAGEASSIDVACNLIHDGFELHPYHKMELAHPSTGMSCHPSSSLWSKSSRARSPFLWFEPSKFRPWFLRSESLNVP